jgi:hypothetical protein
VSASSLPFADVPLVDHHAHAVLRRAPTLDELRGLFSESQHPAQWRHVPFQLSYRRGLRELADMLGVEPSEQAVHAYRLASDPAAYAERLLRATGTEWLLLDDGFPLAEESFGLAQMAGFCGGRALPVLRLERVAEGALGGSLDELRESVRAAVRGARGAGYAGLKTVAAYRSGLDVQPPSLEAAAAALAERPARLAAKPLVDLVLLDALEANTAEPLPLQVHAGFGDADLLLPKADPSLLKPVLERYPGTPFVLLHCYPFVREAGWLAHVYPNVHLDVSLTIPHSARPLAALEEALELAPASKLLYASDAARTPELYYLAACRFRRALGQLLAREPGADELAERILRRNAIELYGLT